MHHWSFYFLAKLGLFYAGRMNFHWPANLLLALRADAGLAEEEWDDDDDWEDDDECEVIYVKD